VTVLARGGLAAYGLDPAALAAQLGAWKGAPRSDQFLNELLVDVRPWRKLPAGELAQRIEEQPLAVLSLLELTHEAQLHQPGGGEAQFLAPFTDRAILQRYILLEWPESDEALDLPRTFVRHTAGPIDLIAFIQTVLRWAQRFAHWNAHDVDALPRINRQFPLFTAFLQPPVEPLTALLHDFIRLLGVRLVLLSTLPASQAALEGLLQEQLGLKPTRRKPQQQRFDFREAGGNENSIYVVRAIGGVDGYDVRGTVGPDLALIIDIGDREISVAATAYLEEHVLRTINSQTELHAERVGGSVRLRWYDTRLEAADLGRLIYEALKAQFILSVISVNMIFDPLRIGSLKPGIFAYREERETQLRKRSEDNSPFILCSSCRAYAPHTSCIATAERSPCCGRSYDELATLAQLTSGTEQLAIEKGICQDRSRGRFVGTDKLSALYSEGANGQVNLHSLRVSPHLTSAIPECIAYWIDEVEAICVVSADYTGRLPDGKTYETLLVRVAGRQVPGVVGVSEAYILSPRFLAAEGGLARVGWMNSALKARLKLTAGHILTENECTNLAGLKERQAPWRK
jgi:hypothetical protein